MTEINAARLRELRREYRRTMDVDVLHAWAGDVALLLDNLADLFDGGTESGLEPVAWRYTSPNGTPAFYTDRVPSFNRGRVEPWTETPLYAALVASPPVAESDGWQPISTAPKNRPFFATFDSHPSAMCWWDKASKSWCYAPCMTEGGDSPISWHELPAAPRHDDGRNLTPEEADRVSKEMGF
jgi:hypothetical protein